MPTNTPGTSRPLSPHLSIYKPQWTSGYSILHRLSGIALSVGTLVIAAWLIALATNVDAFVALNHWLATWFGKLVMFGFLFSLYYHFMNGIRHLVWDTGYGIDLVSGRISGHFCGLGSLMLTTVSALLLW